MSDFNTTDILKALAEIERTLTFVLYPGEDNEETVQVRADEDPPNSISETDLPKFINITGESSVDWTGESDVEAIGDDATIFRCLYYAVPRGAGVSGEIVRRTKPIMDKFPPLIHGRQSLACASFPEGVAEIEKVTYLGHGGITELIYQDSPYLGVEFRVQVTAHVHVPHVDYVEE